MQSGLDVGSRPNLGGLARISELENLMRSPLTDNCLLAWAMAAIRRYLRISKYSVLECRIFLENPADGPRWLLKPGDPALPRIFEAIKPLVLPKLREENESAKGKGKKKKASEDVVKQGELNFPTMYQP